jgi:hypothetical protein
MKTLVATTVALALLPAATLAQAAASVDTGSRSMASATAITLPVESTKINQQATKRVDLNDIKMILFAKASVAGDNTPIKPCTQLSPMC